MVLLLYIKKDVEEGNIKKIEKSETKQNEKMKRENHFFPNWFANNGSKFIPKNG